MGARALWGTQSFPLFLTSRGDADTCSVLSPDGGWYIFHQLISLGSVLKALGVVFFLAGGASPSCFLTP